MPISLDQVQPAMAYLHPNLHNGVISVVRFLLPYWLRYRAGIAKVETRHIDRLVELMQQFQAGKVKYIIAFRHPTIDDQFAMLHLLSRDVPHAAAQMGIKLKQPVHSYFVYDRGIPLWAGKIATWLYPRVGGLPIYRGKLDRQGLAAIRQHLLEASYPVAISPEGGTNGHNELVSVIEPGTAQIGFWCAEDLEKAGRSESVVILPVGIQYQYLGAPWAKIDQMLMQLEKDCGLSKPAIHSSKPSQVRYERLFALGEHLIESVSEHYKKFYSQAAVIPPESESLHTRLQALLEQILHVSESHFDINPKGSLVDRCRRLEQSVFDQIFRIDIKDINSLPALEQGLANQLAKEAHTSEWHMRIAESLTAITGTYVKENPSPTRFADTLLLIWRALSRVQSELFGRPPYIGDRKVILAIGEPISVSDRYATYKSSRAAAKECTSQLTKDLQLALESLIEASPFEVS